MKTFFFGSNFDQWCSIANLLGFDSYIVGIESQSLYPYVKYSTNIEDEPSNIVFIPEHIPISKIKSIVKKAKIIIVWRDYKTGTIENIDHELNIATKTYIEKKIQNSIYIPEYVHDVFKFYKSIPKIPTKITSDEDLENKSLIQIAQTLKDTSVYTGKQFIPEAQACGCQTALQTNEPPVTKTYTANKLFEMLSKMEIFSRCVDGV